MAEESDISKQEKTLLKRREFIIKGFFAVAFSGLAIRLWNLQVIDGSKYKKLSEENRIRLLPTSGARGLIYDKNKSILAKNILSYDLVITPDNIDIKKTIRKISSTLGIPYRSLLANFNLNRNRANFEPIKIYSNLTWNQVVLVETYQEEFLGIAININQLRFYPQKQYSAHILGHVNQIDKAQLKKITLDKIKSATFVGRTGVEENYNKQLLGIDGDLRIEVNSYGKVINTQYIKPPIAGRSIYLNIDKKLQNHIYSIFKNKKGAAIIMDPWTGKVNAMCSNPSFDPNAFSSYLSKASWKNLASNNEGFLNNRCIQGIYSPGSTFKMLVALAALEEGLITKNYTYTCNGHYRLNRKVYYCWKRSGHGKIDLVQAIANSCNTFFYYLGLELGADKIHDYAVKIGLGKKTGIDLPNEKKGLIPSVAWKKKYKNDKWFLGETIGVSIGQNYVSVTPIQLINYVNALVNGGKIIEPRIVDYIEDRGEKIEQQAANKFLNFNPENIEIILEGMRQSVSSASGTSRFAANPYFTMGGKTGTTQIISRSTRQKIIAEKGAIAENLEDHAWFVGFAPAKKPKFTIVVLLENGKSGRYAASLAKNILSPYFKNQFTS